MEESYVEQQRKRRNKVLIGGLGILGAIFLILVVVPHVQVKSLAKDTCKDMEGMMLIAAAGLLKKRTEEAEDLGFSGPEFGNKLREECPAIMQQFEDFVRKFNR